jgi:hypothetical protein
VITTLLACFAYAAVDNTLTLAEKKAGWKLLFNGKTLDGWQITGNPNGWAVQEGAIVNLARGGGNIATKEKFSNFILSFEVKLEKGANSGVWIRWSDLRDPVQNAIEVQILDSYGKKKPDKHDMGAIYDCQAPFREAYKPAGEWNKMVITCRDNLIWVDLNGKRITYMNLDRWTQPHQNPDGTSNKFDTAYKDMPRTGYIGFQDHGSKVWFKNIKIKPLPPLKR